MWIIALKKILRRKDSTVLNRYKIWLESFNHISKYPLLWGSRPTHFFFLLLINNLTFCLIKEINHSRALPLYNYLLPHIFQKFPSLLALSVYNKVQTSPRLKKKRVKDLFLTTFLDTTLDPSLLHGASLKNIPVYSLPHGGMPTNFSAHNQHQTLIHSVSQNYSSENCHWLPWCQIHWTQFNVITHAFPANWPLTLLDTFSSLGFHSTLTCFSLCVHS